MKMERNYTGLGLSMIIVIVDPTKSIKRVQKWKRMGFTKQIDWIANNNLSPFKNLNIF